MEEWRDIKNYEGIYQVSDMGNLKSLKRVVSNGERKRNVNEKLLKFSEERGGHLVANLSFEGKVKKVFIHKLVLESFFCQRPDGMECCHKDGNPKNNCLTNLRWDTHENNQKDMSKHGTSNRGEKCSMNILSEKDVRRIRTLIKTPMIQKDIAEEYGVCHSTISNIKSGRSWGWLK